MAILLLTGLSVVPLNTRAQASLVNGENHTGAISVPRETDTWTFEAAKGNTITLSLVELSGEAGDLPFWPWIRLRGPDGAQLAAQTRPQAAYINVVAALSGTYTVLVADESVTGGGDQTARYILRLAKTPGTFDVPAGDDGGPLTNGANHPGKVDVGDLDLWTFDAAKGDTISLSLAEVFEGETDPGFWPWIRVIGPDGAQIVAKSARLAAYVNVVAPLSGTYTVVVADESATGGGDIPGSYLLRLAKTPGEFVTPANDNGGILTNGVNQPGRIDLGDLDLWTFQAAKGDSLALSLAEVFEGETDPGFWPWIRLRGPNGVQIGGASQRLAAYLNVVAPLTGTYTVVVADESATGGGEIEGSYILRLAKTPGEFSVPAGDHGGTLTNGLNQAGRVDIGDLDLWTFHATKGDAIALSLAEVFEGETDPGFWPWIRLRGPDGAQIGGTSQRLAAYLNVLAPLTGTYTVVVGDESVTGGGDTAGSYVLRLAMTPGLFEIPASDEGGQLANGGNHEGKINLGDLDLWTFNAAKGDNIALTVAEVVTSEIDPGFWPWIRLRGPDGVQLGAQSGDSAAFINFTAPLTGAYAVLVADESVTGGGDSVGTYLLRLALSPEKFIVPTNDDGGTLTRETANRGKIDPGDLDMWNFGANAGDSISLTITNLNADLDFYPLIRLYGPGGILVGSQSGSDQARITFRALDSGLFTLLVGDGNNGRDKTGEYDVLATGLPEQNRQLRTQRLVNAMLKICWPSELKGHVLQQNLGLEPEGWTNVASILDDNGLNTIATIPIESANRFFRLRPPNP